MAYTRKDVSALTAGERRRFVGALLKLKQRGEYDEFVRTHIDYYVSDGDGGLRTAHMAPSFLPWHRQFLLELETALRRVDDSVTIPYWDWTRDRTTTSVPWTADLLGGNGRPKDHRVMTGPFAYGYGKWTIREGLTDVEYLTRDLGYPRTPIDLPTRKDLDAALAETVYDKSPWNSVTSGGFRNRVEGWGKGTGNGSWLNHNRVHRWVGGHMVGGASVNDPVFWLHHAFIDLQWTRWQQRHPGARYVPAQQPKEGDRERGRVVARDERMPPWEVTPGEMEQIGHVYRYA
ncbi:tyrosinase family protein [Streptomyces sp. NPDC002643]